MNLSINDTPSFKKNAKWERDLTSAISGEFWHNVVLIIIAILVGWLSKEVKIFLLGVTHFLVITRDITPHFNSGT